MAIQKADLFDISVTEFVLILAFVFLVLATVFQQEKLKFEDDHKDTAEILVLLDQVIAEFNKMAINLGVSPVDSAVTVDKLKELRREIEGINGYVNQPANISEDWDTLIYVKDIMANEGIDKDGLGGLIEAGLAFDDNREDFADAQRDRDAAEEGLKQCAEKFEVQRRRCGTGYPLCNGSGKFLAQLELFDEGIIVSVLSDIQGLSGEGFSNQLYSLEEFSKVGEQYLLYSQKQLPECRYQVKYIDRTSSSAKEWFKSLTDVIDVPFYKVEINR